MSDKDTPPPIGTIVRLREYSQSMPYAVVVPSDYAKNYKPRDWDDTYAFTRLLENPCNYYGAIKGQGGWYIGDGNVGRYDYDVISEDEVPNDIAALAGRALLDRDFVPFS